MKTVAFLVLSALMTGCAADDVVPAWALDTLYLEADGDGVYGLHAWELFGERWSKHRAARHHVCSILVSFEGEPTAAPSCAGCEHAWVVETSFVDSECEAAWADDERFLSLTAIALGAVPDELDPADDPHPGQSSGAWADYGAGWEAYGWGFPQALDQDEPVDEVAWTGEHAFSLWPAWVWDLQTP